MTSSWVSGPPPENFHDTAAGSSSSCSPPFAWQLGTAGMTTETTGTLRLLHIFHCRMEPPGWPFLAAAGRVCVASSASAS